MWVIFYPLNKNKEFLDKENKANFLGSLSFFLKKSYITEPYENGPFFSMCSLKKSPSAKPTAALFMRNFEFISPPNPKMLAEMTVYSQFLETYIIKVPK